MQQVLFRVPFLGVPIYGYGAMLVIGFFAAIALEKFLARRSGQDPEVFVNASLIALVAGVVGARLSHVLENLDDFTRADLSVWQNLANVFNMRSGGLTYYGGFLLAFPITVLYGVKKKVSIRLGMDIVAPALMVGLGFGRVGCFLNGCCHGAECDLPWAVSFPYYSNAYQDQFADRERPLPVPSALVEEDTKTHRLQLVPPDRLRKEGPLVWGLAQGQRSRRVHPAQLYSTITAWLLAGLLVAYFAMPHAPGRVFALMMMLEGATRFLLEMLRTEPPVLGRLSLSMVIGVGLVIGGGLLWFVFGRSDQSEPGEPQGVGATT